MPAPQSLLCLLAAKTCHEEGAVSGWPAIVGTRVLFSATRCGTLELARGRGLLQMTRRSTPELAGARGLLPMARHGTLELAGARDLLLMARHGTPEPVGTRGFSFSFVLF
jgi:hypothetical protein